jgi:hypothetical protein
MQRWITGEADVSQQRVEQAVAASDAQAHEMERIEREHRDLQTAFRLELALDKFPQYLL